MKQIKRQSRSVYFMVILFLILLAAQVVMYGNFFRELRNGAAAINDLSRARGSIQRYAKLELSNVSKSDLDLENYIDSLIARHLNSSHPKDLEKITLYHDLDKLNEKWGELKSLIRDYHTSPNRELLLSVIDKSEECWELADAYVVSQQYIAKKTETYFKYFTITFGINLFAIALVLFLYKRFVLNNIASSAINDPLTEIFNKGYFDEYLEHEIARAVRRQTAFSLIMFDIDRFKRVNDTYGHRRGDYALKTLAAVVRETKRNADVLARIGGEEFIVLLPDTGLPEAVQLAERIRVKVENYSFEEIGRMTISLGITEFRQTDNKESLLKRVDSALYRAKENGRNRCEIIGREANHE